MSTTVTKAQEVVGPKTYSITMKGGEENPIKGRVENYMEKGQAYIGEQTSKVEKIGKEFEDRKEAETDTNLGNIAELLAKLTYFHRIDSEIRERLPVRD